MKTLGNTALIRLKAAVFVLALVPLAKLAANGYLDHLGANPIEKVSRTTGYWTLTLLSVTLAATPVRLLTGWSWIIRLRRMFGLFAFFYGCLHFLTYLVLDQFFDWSAIAADISKRPYITIGFPAFLLMVPLAATSTDRMVRKLGGKTWKRLHRLVYASAVGGAVHYWWLVKKDISGPLTFALVLGLLLALRIVFRLKRLANDPARTADSPIRRLKDRAASVFMFRRGA